MSVLRQGDVLLVAVAALPASNLKLCTDVVLAYGEITGHAHKIESPHAKLWDAGAERFLQAMETVALTHEEHSPIDIPAGIYRVVIQSEYRPGELRNVTD